MYAVLNGQADLKGYSFAREDVNARALANAYGQTLGKQVMGIKVVHVGGPLGPGGVSGDAALKRAGVMWGANFLTWIPLLGAVFYIFPLVNAIWLFIDKPLQQCLHDKVANTVVVKVK